MRPVDYCRNLVQSLLVSGEVASQDWILVTQDDPIVYPIKGPLPEGNDGLGIHWYLDPQCVFEALYLDMCGIVITEITQLRDLIESCHNVLIWGNTIELESVHLVN